MAWYAVNAVLWVRFIDGLDQETYPIWENVYLVEAPDHGAARSAGETIARRDEGDSNGSFRWDGRSAEWVFAGIRKVTSCTDADQRPAYGTELTYSEFEAPSLDAVMKLAGGQPVSVTYIE